jgi:hypothetical protein
MNERANFMARQLNSDEQRHFAVALQNPEMLIGSGNTFQETIDTRRDAALGLSPELQAWFGREFLPWNES